MELLDFSALFVYSARSFIDEGPGLQASIFTSRQSQAIGALGTARILRTRDALGVKDLVELAIITSPPKAQKYAEMIAFRILLGDERELFKSIKNIKAKKTQLKEKKEEILPKPSFANSSTSIISSLDLQHILKLLNLEHSVNSDKDSEILEYLNQLEEQLFQNPPKQPTLKNLDWAQLRTAFDIIGGREGILNGCIASDEKLLQEATRHLKKQVPVISDDQLVDGAILALLNEVKELSSEEFVRKQAELLQNLRSSKKMNAKEISDILKDLSQPELEKMEKTAKLIEKAGDQLKLDNSVFLPNLDYLKQQFEKLKRQNISTLNDILKQPHVFKSGISYHKMEEIIQNSIQDHNNILELLKDAESLDNILHTNFAEKIAQKMNKKLDQLSLDELLQQPLAMPEWLERVEKHFQNTEKTDWQKQWETTQKLEKAMDTASNSHITQEMEKMAHQSIKDQIRASKTKDQIQQTVEKAREEGVSHDKRELKIKGEQLKMSKEEIANMIGDAYEVVKMMIEDDDPSFERMNTILPHADLSTMQTDQLIKASLENEASGALAGFMDHNFGQTMKQISNSQRDQQLMKEAIGAGGGENLLKEWYLHGQNMPPWMRDLVKQVAKEILIEQGKKRASMLMGSSEAGPLPEGSIRPYNLGDDPDTIDLEETLENILSLGKTIDQVKADDLIVRKTVTGRRCVIFLIDISGSMNGQPLAAAAMATVMLLYAFARDELGIALFESSTHVICEINQPVDIDSIADEILDLRARGGTQMQAAIQWAEKQFQKSISQDKMFVMITDAMLGDFHRSEPHMRNIADQGATSVLCVPANGYGLGNIQSIVNAAKCQLVTIKDWKDFPNQVSEILNRG